MYVYYVCTRARCTAASAAANDKYHHCMTTGIGISRFVHLSIRKSNKALSLDCSQGIAQAQKPSLDGATMSTAESWSNMPAAAPDTGEVQALQANSNL